MADICTESWGLRHWERGGLGLDGDQIFPEDHSEGCPEGRRGALEVNKKQHS
jgi:hypothetical protein